MKYDHNQICTTGKEVKVGKAYQYKEASWIADVKVISEISDASGISFELKILRQNYKIGIEDTFTCWAAHGKYGYSGMWRLFDLGTYRKVES